MADPQNKFLKSLIDLGNDFLNVFTSFGDIVSKVLGFSTETKKSDVGAYFKTVQDTIQGTKDKLNKIVTDMKSEGNPNAAETETAVNKLISETLDKIIDVAKTVSEAIGDASDPIGNVAVQNNGGVVGDVDKLVKGIKSIVDVVLKDVGNPEVGDVNKAEDGSAGNNDGVGKLFASDNAVAAVNNAKDAVMAGGIALRSMAKGGKFANSSDADVAAAVKGAAVSAVIKALDTLTIAIRKTIDAGLKTVKEAMKINANDTPITPEQSAPKGTTN
ncbi:variable large family protein (plasmid) [Borrelia hermsii DAH]|uniref:Variable large protein n=3 Tax=Borrelia hermsii TaxID=140 RepID=Q5MBS4_BORHE|nr:Vlp43 [Borrelia hermsii]ANA43976.1 VlpC43-2 [Borrelia hermsii HS1]UPA08365.1 variable large family protein [Borrelia hermsii DAH]